MRLFISLTLVACGICLFVVSNLSQAFIHAPVTSFYYNQLNSFPEKETYSRTELTDAVWQVWTNRVSLPAKDAYLSSDLKEALVNRSIGSSQDSCDRAMFENAIARAAGYQKQSDTGLKAIGFAAILLGAFLLGGILFPSQGKPADKDSTK